MSGVQMRTVSAADDGMRLDRWFKQHFPALKHGQLQKLLRKGQIRVDGGRVPADRRVLRGEVIRVPPMDEDIKPKPVAHDRMNAEDKDYIRSLVLYEDKDIIAINKPFGLAVQGGAKTTRHVDGMLDGLIYNGERPRLVHRLDRDTGGLLVLGRTRKAAAALSEAFQKHTVQKTYWALVKRVPHPLQGRIDLAVDKSGGEGKERMRPSDDGKRALTDYQVVEMAGQKACFVALRPITGRTHQIRVHLSAIVNPIVGDRKYGGEDAMLEGVSPKMHLFCRHLTIPLPGRKPFSLSAPLTGHMAKTWDFFSFEQPDNLEWPE